MGKICSVTDITFPVFCYLCCIELLRLKALKGKDCWKNNGNSALPKHPIKELGKVDGSRGIPTLRKNALYKSVETVTLPPLLVRILLLKLNSLPPYKVGLDFVDWLIVLQKP